MTDQSIADAPMPDALRFLVKQALRGVDELPAGARVTLYEGLAMIAPPRAAENARKLAFINRELAAQQETLQASLFPA